MDGFNRRYTRTAKLMCEYDGTDRLLFDLHDDPGGTVNRATPHPKIAERLSKLLLACHASMPLDNGPRFRRLGRRKKRKPPGKVK